MRLGEFGFVLDREITGKGLTVSAELKVVEFLLEYLVQVDGLLQGLFVLGGSVEFAQCVNGQGLVAQEGISVLLLTPNAG